MSKMEEKLEIPNFGEICLRRKQRRKRQKLLINELILDYAKNSTLHGLRYLSERGLSIIEKTFWLVTFVMSVTMCFILIHNVWIKWKTSPVIVSFSEHIVPVGKVPFPSVTICPQLKCKASVYNYSKEYSKFITYTGPEMTDSEKEMLQDISLVCHGMERVTEQLYKNASVVDHIYKVAPTHRDVFELCLWRNEYYKCSEVFSTVLTTEGLCYNFNSLSAHEILRKENIQSDYVYLSSTTESKNWSMSDEYESFDEDTYPRRGRENGASPDLEVILKEKIAERDDLCNNLHKGYKIYVQHPGDYPQSSLYYYAALTNQVSSLALKVNMLTTSSSLRGYSSEVRQCYFPGDRPLRFFAIYTSSNCRLECQANYTFQRCGCVAFHMPHNDSRKICTFTSLDCVNDAKDHLSMEEIKADPMEAESACRCFPPCHSITYDAEILKTDFDYLHFFKTYEKIYNDSFVDKGMQYSKIELYFKDPRYVSMRRSELFGLTDFLANCGGLLGLFLGFSFLSLVEIAYFVTLRLCCTLKHDLRAEKKEGEKRND